MLIRANLLSGRSKYLFGFLLLLFIALIGLAFSMEGSDSYDIARREILLRRVGHEILLQSGDSTSRVLPVKKLASNEYQLSFEKAFSFQPDQLVKTTQGLLSKDPFTKDYIVNVLHCGNSSVVYGYAVSGNKKDDIISCLGRKQPVACYLINIKFQPGATSNAKTGYLLLGSLALLAILAYFILNRPKTQPAPAENQPESSPNSSSHTFTLGTILFDAEARKLLAQGNIIELTKTETRVLRIFAMSPNQVIERGRLQKEIWEDEGVIVGRSLDMFISKLRKKLESDPSLRISVIRGKGYKLETEA